MNFGSTLRGPILKGLIESYVYKKEVDWSLLTEGLTLPIDNQVIFSRNMGSFLQRGESKSINLYLDGKTYTAKITNVNFNAQKYKRKDVLQIRYKRNGELANKLKAIFSQSYDFIVGEKRLRDPNNRSKIRVPDSCIEQLAIYTTEFEDSYVLESIQANDIYVLRDVINQGSERIMESGFNYDIVDETSTIFEDYRIKKIRKLNRAIGDNLKLLYDFHCQICGQRIGEDYSTNIAEAHHIDYFVKSLNNDSRNQMIVCPNHHTIIHDINPVFDREELAFYILMV